MRETKKEFSVLKWFVFPVFSLACGVIIAAFNWRIFGLLDSLPYLFAFACIVAFSIMLGTYLSSRDMVIVKTAFVCELLLAVSLAIVTVYCLYVQREMLIAKNGMIANVQTVQAIASLSSKSAQREAVKHLDLSDKSSIVFKNHEKALFIAAMIEFSAYLFCAFLLLGITHLRKQGTELRLNSEKEERELRLNSEKEERELSLNSDRSASLRPARQVSLMSLPKTREVIKYEKKGKPDLVLYPVPGGYKIHIKNPSETRGKYLCYISQHVFDKRINTYTDIQKYLEEKSKL